MTATPTWRWSPGAGLPGSVFACLPGACEPHRNPAFLLETEGLLLSLGNSAIKQNRKHRRSSGPLTVPSTQQRNNKSSGRATAVAQRDRPKYDRSGPGPWRRGREWDVRGREAPAGLSHVAPWLRRVVAESCRPDLPGPEAGDAGAVVLGLSSAGHRTCHCTCLGPGSPRDGRSGGSPFRPAAWCAGPSEAPLPRCDGC